MAEDFNLKPDQAKALQSAMQVIEKLIGKSAGHSDRLFGNIDKTIGKHQTYLNQKEKVLDFTKDLAKENKTIETSMKIKKLLIGSNLTIEQAELVVAKEKAIQEARSAGIAESRIKVLEREYENAVKVADENARLNNLQEQQEELAQKILQYEEERKAALEGINSTAAVFKDIMTDGRLAAGIFTGQLIKGYKSSKEVFEGVREQGIGITGAFKETGLAISDAFSFSAVSAKDSMEATKGLRSELGSISEVTRDVRINAGQLAATYGISNEEAGKLTAQVSKLPGSSLEAANGTLEFAGNMAKAAGVAPGDVMRDIAGNADAMATYAKDGGKNIAVAAVAAKKLGVEFGTIVSSAESLLDFESSIEKQMEASVLLGREINLDKARQLALEGDLVGATEEVLKNVGSEAEFNKLNVMQRKVLAENMGVSVSQLGSMVKNQDKLSSLTQEQRDALSSGEASMDEILSSSVGFAGKLKEGGITVFSLVKGIGEFSRGMKSSVEGAKAFFGGFKSGSGLIDKVKKGVGGLFTGGDKAAQIEKPEITPPDSDKVLDGVKKGTDKAGDMNEAAAKQKPLKGFETAMKNLRKGIAEFAKKPGKTLKGVGVLVISGAMLGVGLAAIAMGVKAMGGSPKDMIDTGIALALFAGSMFLMSKSLGKMSVGAVLKGAGALVVLGAALIPAAFAFSLLKGVDVGSIVAFSIALPLLGLAAAGLGFLFPFIALGAGALAILGGALILVAASMMMFASAGDGTTALQEFLGTFAENPSVGINLFGAAAGLLAFGAAALYSSVGLALGAIGLMAMAPGLYMINEIAQNNVIGDLSTNLMNLSASASGLGAVGASLFGVAGGLGAMALAGFAALPIIGSLIALAAVAPALGKLADVFGGGGSDEDDKLGEIADKLDTLISVASQGGVINMDGKKVGDVVRLSITSSGIK